MGTVTGVRSFDGEAMAAELAAWAGIESPTYDAAGVNRMIDLVAAGAGGLAVERVPGRDGLGDALIVRAGPATGAPGLVVLSHLDTVHPVGTAATGLPVRREGDRLYGPGTYDMKGGALLAWHAFRAAAARARAPLTFVFTPDEEIGSPTSRALIEDLSRGAAAVLVTEPARDGGRIVTARKGVGRFEVSVEGRPSHAGSRHSDGRSAIRAAARVVLAVEAMTDYARGVTTTVGLVSGGTAVNVVPQHCRLSVDLRVTTPEDGEAMTRAILALAGEDDGVVVSVTGAMNRPPMPKSPPVAALLARAAALAAEVGIVLEDVPMVGGGSDGNFTAALGVPTLDGLGCDGDGAHTLREHALVSSLAPRAALMERLLTGLT